jgi:hypothetical protein
VWNLLQCDGKEETAFVSSIGAVPLPAADSFHASSYYVLCQFPYLPNHQRFHLGSFFFEQKFILALAARSRAASTP